MPTSTPARSAVHRLTPETLLLILSPEGRYLSARGPGLARIGEGALVGRTLEEVLADHPGVAALWRQQLAARRPFRRVIEAFGCAWLADAEPLYDGERYLGMATLATVLEETPGATARRKVQTWVCTFPLRAGTALLMPGDVVVDDGAGASVTRVLPEDALTRLRPHYGGPSLRPPAPAAQPHPPTSPAPAPRCLRAL